MRTLALSMLALVVATQSFGCTTEVAKKAPSEETGTPTEEPATDDEALPPAADAEKFGDPINPQTPEVALADVLANPEAYKNKQITVTGTVRQVCQKRGCWAEIRPEEARESETMRVTFKGYAFFLPKDSRGANVKLEGRVSIMLLTPEQVEELENEGATFTNKKEDGSAISTEFIAAGVEMTGRKK